MRQRPNRLNALRRATRTRARGDLAYVDDPGISNRMKLAWLLKDLEGKEPESEEGRPIYDSWYRLVQDVMVSPDTRESMLGLKAFIGFREYESARKSRLMPQMVEELRARIRKSGEISRERRKTAAPSTAV